MKRLRFGQFEMEPDTQLLYRNGQRVHLTPKAAAVLGYLVRQPGKLATKERLFAEVWPDAIVEEGSLTQTVSQLRRALGDAGQLIETVSKRGYIFTGEVVSESAVPLPVAGNPWRRRTIFVAAALVCAGALWLMARGPIPIKSVAVLPLRDSSGDAGQEYFEEGVTDLLTNELAKLRRVRIISSSSARHYRDRKMPLARIARELKVDALVSGSLRRSGDHLRLDLELVQANGTRQWAATYGRDVADILTLQCEIARAIAASIQLEPGTKDDVRAACARPIHRTSFEAYLRGRHQWNKREPESIRKAIGYFELSIDSDPLCAAAYAGLADAYNQSGTYFIGAKPPSASRPLAIAAARKAIEIDPDLAEAHAALGYALMFDWDWKGAEQSLRRAIELNPSYAPARQWYAYLLAIRKRFDEAISQIRLAAELDPLALIIQTQIGWIQGFARRWDESVQTLDGVLKRDPEFQWALWRLGSTYMDMGRYAEAVAVLERAAKGSQRSTSILGTLAAAYGYAGRKADARKVLAELTARAETAYVSPHAFTWVYLGLGERDKVFEYLEREYRDRANSMAWNGVLHALDPYRSDPRMKDLLRRTGLAD